MNTTEKGIPELNRRPLDEMHHSDWLIQRMIVPEGAPAVVGLSSMKMDWALPEMTTIGRFDEPDGTCSINGAIRPAQEPGDQVTAELLQRIILREEGGLVWAEEHGDQTKGKGSEDVLANQNSLGTA